jgi:hypothetical protein
VKNSKAALKACHARWAKAHPARVRELANANYKTHGEWYRFNRRLKRYNLTLDQYHALAERQNFCCGICHEETDLTIDHDHETEEVRGLLCPNCNSGIGRLRDSLELLKNAQTYLEMAA